MPFPAPNRATFVTPVTTRVAKIACAAQKAFPQLPKKGGYSGYSSYNVDFMTITRGRGRCVSCELFMQHMILLRAQLQRELDVAGTLLYTRTWLDGTGHGWKMRLLRLKDVIAMTGLTRSNVYALEAAGKFPKRRRITDKCVAWRSDEVQAWIDALPMAAHP